MHKAPHSFTAVLLSLRDVFFSEVLVRFIPPSTRSIMESTGRLVSDGMDKLVCVIVSLHAVLWKGYFLSSKVS